MLASVNVVQRSFLIVVGAEDYLTIVRRESTAAAAPHLRGQDPRDVGSRRLRHSFSLKPIALGEGEAALIVRSPLDLLHACLQEFLERAAKLREVHDGVPLEVAWQEMKLS